MKKALLSSVMAIVFVLAGSSSAHAANLNGWAWSSNFGWISFNSNDSSAGGGPYAVTVNNGGQFDGYAWSPNVGWISFNQNDVTPAHCGAGAGRGQLNMSTGEVTGFARALSIPGSDGCIELSGANHTSPDLSGNGGVTFDFSTGIFRGYAWGGDTAAHTGIGWIQFDPSVNVPVQCLSTDCNYTGNISGTCTMNPPNPHLTSPVTVTFTATPTGGNGPYEYSWSGAAYTSSNQYTPQPYTQSGLGPTVTIRDSGNLVTQPIDCGSVGVVSPLTSSNIQIGRTVATANSSSLTIKQATPFALRWNMTLTDDYSCTRYVTPVDATHPEWYSSWVAGLSGTNNNDGTITWSGDTSTTLKSGTVAAPATPAVYQFGISCTSSLTPVPNAPQGASATLKVNSSSVKEI